MFNTSELDELFRILISIKGIKFRQPQWSNTTLRMQDKTKGKYDENIYSVKGQCRNELYKRAESMVPQLDGTYNVSDDSNTNSHSYLDLASSNIIAHRM